MAERWAAFFEDRADGGAIRAEHVGAHQAFLRANKGKIVLVGALRPDAEGAPVGGLWIFENVSGAEAEAIIQSDPFYVNGLRASYKLLSWGVAPGFEAMVIQESL